MRYYAVNMNDSDVCMSACKAYFFVIVYCYTILFNISTAAKTSSIKREDFGFTSSGDELTYSDFYIDKIFGDRNRKINQKSSTRDINELSQPRILAVIFDDVPSAASFSDGDNSMNRWGSWSSIFSIPASLASSVKLPSIANSQSQEELRSVKLGNAQELYRTVFLDDNQSDNSDALNSLPPQSNQNLISQPSKSFSPPQSSFQSPLLSLSQSLRHSQHLGSSKSLISMSQKPLYPQKPRLSKSLSSLLQSESPSVVVAPPQEKTKRQKYNQSPHKSHIEQTTFTSAEVKEAETGIRKVADQKEMRINNGAFKSKHLDFPLSKSLPSLFQEESPKHTKSSSLNSLSSLTPSRLDLNVVALQKKQEQQTPQEQQVQDQKQQKNQFLPVSPLPLVVRPEVKVVAFDSYVDETDLTQKERAPISAKLIFYALKKEVHAIEVLFENDAALKQLSKINQGRFEEHGDSSSKPRAVIQGNIEKRLCLNALRKIRIQRFQYSGSSGSRRPSSLRFSKQYVEGTDTIQGNVVKTQIMFLNHQHLGIQCTIQLVDIYPQNVPSKLRRRTGWANIQSTRLKLLPHIWPTVSLKTREAFPSLSSTDKEYYSVNILVLYINQDGHETFIPFRNNPVSMRSNSFRITKPGAEQAICDESKKKVIHSSISTLELFGVTNEVANQCAHTKKSMTNKLLLEARSSSTNLERLGDIINFSKAQSSFGTSLKLIFLKKISERQLTCIYEAPNDFEKSCAANNLILKGFLDYSKTLVHATIDLHQQKQLDTGQETLSSLYANIQEQQRTLKKPLPSLLQRQKIIKQIKDVI